MLRRFTCATNRIGQPKSSECISTVTYQSSKLTQQKRGIIFFTSSNASGPNVIIARERMALNLLAEALALYLTFKLLKVRKRRKASDIFDFVKSCGINADELADSNLFSYENYRFDLRFFGNYIAICAALCLVTLVFPASFHGPSLTRVIMSTARRSKMRK